MENSRQSATIFSPSSKRPTKRTRLSITEHSFQGIASSPRGGSVTYVSGTNCHPCVGSLRTDPTLRHLIVSFSPKASHPVAFERCFITDDRYILGLSLGDEHTVKWVFVRARQESSPNAMLWRN